MFPPSTGRGIALTKGEVSGLNHLVFAACSPLEQSHLFNFGGAKRSLFTVAFVKKALTIPDSGAAEFQSAVYAEMQALDQEKAKRQHPEYESYSSSLTLNKLLNPGGGQSAAPAAPVPLQVSQRAEIGNDSFPTDFPVVVDTRSVVYDGDLLVVSVTSEADGYLRLYYVNNEGVAKLLFPNQYADSNRISRSQPVTIGGEDSPFRFTVRPPEGRQALVAVVSKSPFSQQAGSTDLGRTRSLWNLSNTGLKDVLIEPAYSGTSSNRREQKIGRGHKLFEIKRR
jgi:hypothetical protein